MLVWQHHLFVSGINGDLRPFYMLSTELISIPTGFMFLCGMRTLWRGQIRYTVPMLFCLAWFFNFLFGGLSGVFLSDVPSDVTTHGSFFSMAHFHYTIMGGLVFTFFAAIYYWLPKMTGLQLNERLGKIHFWTMFVSFNSTFAPLFAIGFLGQPRRVVTYPPNLQFLNDWVSVSAFVLGLSMLVFLYNLVCSLLFARVPAPANPWGSKSLEWQLPSPVPVHNFDRIPVFCPTRTATARSRRRVAVPAGAPAGRDRDGEFAQRQRRLRGRRRRTARAPRPESCLRGPPLASATAFFFLGFVFAYFYLRSLNNGGMWQPKHVDPSLTLGTLVTACLVASAVVLRLGPPRPSGGAPPRVAHQGARRARARLAALVLQVGRVDDAGLRARDGGFASVYFGWTAFLSSSCCDDVLARDGARDRDPLPRLAEASASLPARPRATRIGRRTTSATRSRSCAPSSSASPSTGSFLAGIAVCAGSSSTCSNGGRLPLAVCAAAASSTHSAAADGPRRGRAPPFYAGRSRSSSSSTPRSTARPIGSSALHMPQHVLLLTVAPPLLVLGRAWPRLWLPLSARRKARGGARPRRLDGVSARRPRPAEARRLPRPDDDRACALAHPGRSTTRPCETRAFICSSTRASSPRRSLFWGSLLETPPVRARIDHLRRAGWFAAALLPSWTLAVVLGFASSPLYTAYASIPHRTGGLSALADQQLAAGAMWVPGSLAFTIAAVAAFYQWLAPEPTPCPDPRSSHGPDRLVSRRLAAELGDAARPARRGLIYWAVILRRRSRGDA